MPLPSWKESRASKFTRWASEPVRPTVIPQDYAQPEPTPLFGRKFFLVPQGLFDQAAFWLVTRALVFHGAGVTADAHKKVDYILFPTEKQESNHEVANLVITTYKDLPFVTTGWVQDCVTEGKIQPVTVGPQWTEAVAQASVYALLWQFLLDVASFQDVAALTDFATYMETAGEPSQVSVSPCEVDRQLTTSNPLPSSSNGPEDLSKGRGSFAQDTSGVALGLSTKNQASLDDHDQCESADDTMASVDVSISDPSEVFVPNEATDPNTPTSPALSSCSTVADPDIDWSAPDTLVFSTDEDYRSIDNLGALDRPTHSADGGEVVRRNGPNYPPGLGLGAPRFPPSFPSVFLALETTASCPSEIPKPSSASSRALMEEDTPHRAQSSLGAIGFSDVPEENDTVQDSPDVCNSLGPTSPSTPDCTTPPDVPMIVVTPPELGAHVTGATSTTGATNADRPLLSTGVSSLESVTDDTSSAISSPSSVGPSEESLNNTGSSQERTKSKSKNRNRLRRAAEKRKKEKEKEQEELLATAEASHPERDALILQLRPDSQGRYHIPNIILGATDEDEMVAKEEEGDEEGEAAADCPPCLCLEDAFNRFNRLVTVCKCHQEKLEEVLYCKDAWEDLARVTYDDASLPTWESVQAMMEWDMTRHEEPVTKHIVDTYITAIDNISSYDVILAGSVFFDSLTEPMAPHDPDWTAAIQNSSRVVFPLQYMDAWYAFVLDAVTNHAILYDPCRAFRGNPGDVEQILFKICKHLLTNGVRLTNLKLRVVMGRVPVHYTLAPLLVMQACELFAFRGLCHPTLTVLEIFGELLETDGSEIAFNNTTLALGRRLHHPRSCANWLTNAWWCCGGVNCDDGGDRETCLPLTRRPVDELDHYYLYKYPMFKIIGTNQGASLINLTERDIKIEPPRGATPRLIHPATLNPTEGLFQRLLVRTAWAMATNHLSLT